MMLEISIILWDVVIHNCANRTTLKQCWDILYIFICNLENFTLVMNIVQFHQLDKSLTHWPLSLPYSTGLR